MEQCHRFLHSWQDTEPVPRTNFLKMNLWTPHASKQLEIISWPMIFRCIHHTQNSLTQLCTSFKFQHCFLKNMQYPQIIQFADETHLTHQKSDPSDPDCLGHLTHFQPWCVCVYVCVYVCVWMCTCVCVCVLVCVGQCGVLVLFSCACLWNLSCDCFVLYAMFVHACVE